MGKQGVYSNWWAYVHGALMHTLCVFVHSLWLTAKKTCLYKQNGNFVSYTLTERLRLEAADWSDDGSLFSRGVLFVFLTIVNRVFFSSFQG